MRRIFVLALLAALAACQSSNVSRAVGARCDSSSECDVKCLGPDGDWPGGFCTELCDNAAGCPDGTTCIEEDSGICAFTCVADPDCAFLGTGYTCQQIDSHGGGVKVMACHG